MIRRLTDAAERATCAFVASPWSDVSFATGSAWWMLQEAGQPGWIGFDGAATLIAIWIAIATFRSINR